MMRCMNYGFEYNGNFYGIGYGGNGCPIFLSSDDGVKWHSLATIDISAEGNESDMVFKNDSVYICMRVDPRGSKSLWLQSKYPFTEFDCKQMNICLNSPELFIYQDTEEIFLSGREIIADKNLVNSTNVSLFKVDFNGTVDKQHIFQTDNIGDNGYASFVALGDTLYMSYYAGNWEKSSIYVATMSLTKKQIR